MRFETRLFPVAHRKTGKPFDAHFTWPASLPKPASASKCVSPMQPCCTPSKLLQCARAILEETGFANNDHNSLYHESHIATLQHSICKKFSTCSTQYSRCQRASTVLLRQSCHHSMIGPSTTVSSFADFQYVKVGLQQHAA